jgi:hypothetical protein
MKKIISILFLIISVSINLTAQTSNNKAITIQLKELINAVSKGNKEVTATFFNFPVRNEGLKIKIEKTISIKSIDKKVFIRYFNRIFSSDFVNALKKAEILLLETKNQVTTNFKDKKTGCAISLIIDVDKTNLKILSNSNGDEACEFSEFWYFKLINNKLVFQGWNGAG